MGRSAFNGKLLLPHQKPVKSYGTTEDLTIYGIDVQMNCTPEKMLLSISKLFGSLEGDYVL